MAAVEGNKNLQDLFASIPWNKHTNQWNDCWRDSFSPWDRNTPAIALADLLSQRQDLVPPSQELSSRGSPTRGPSGKVYKRTALVPGCGRGHDVLLLSDFGYDVVGLDCSAAGLDAARRNEKEVRREGRAFHEDEQLERGQIEWIAADFFDETWAEGKGTEGSGKFDLIFDYTFLCALPADARPSWARRMSQLITPKGHLVCLEFPSNKPLKAPGPPWGLSPEIYEALLSAPGEPLEYDESGSIVDAPNPKPAEDALHRLSLLKPTRTHAAGTNEDGSVSDFLSVWSL